MNRPVSPFEKASLLLSCLLAWVTVASHAQSVLQSGHWYKVGIAQRGVYRISGDQLQKMGFGSNVDPAHIKMYGNIGGMLPQENNQVRPNDLTEIAILVSTGDDGSFDKNDYILFFAEGPDLVQFKPGKNTFFYESNLYSKLNYYFITVGPDAGKRVSPAVDAPSPSVVIDTFNDYVYHESDEYNELKSGREWFGERYDISTTYSYRFDIEGIVDNTSVTWISDVMAQSFNGSSFKLQFNRTQVAEQIVPVINNTQYGVKGRHKRDTISFQSGTVGAPAVVSQDLRYEYVKSSSGKNVGFLDLMLVSFERKLALYGKQTIFRSSKSLTASQVTYKIGKAGAPLQVWDVTDYSNARVHTTSTSGEVATFSADASLLREFVVFGNDISSPEMVGEVSNQNLHALSPAEVILVTHPSFLSEAQRLASHRQQHNGAAVHVVTTDQIYNEFSSGRQDVSAIRDFVRHIYLKNPSRLQALILFGRGSYDYKDRMPNNTNFIPTYESRNSLSPLETYSSDDFFAFLEAGEGNWGESPVQHHTLDIGVGRLTVKTESEARQVVDKLIAYDALASTNGYWRKDIVFVADDGSNSDGFTSVHQSQANSMAESIESLYPSFDTQKIFLGTYTKTATSNGEVMPEINKEIRGHFKNGALIINYTGHGSEKLLADERVFTEADIDLLDNKLYPFMVTATCEFGRQDDPSLISSAERCVLRANGGAIGILTSARPVNSPTNFLLNQQFYTSLFTRTNGSYRTIGQVFRETKNNSVSGVANRNFSLIGDPSATLALPVERIVVTSVNTTAGSDTLKALSTVTMTGEIRDDLNTPLTNFKGTLEMTVFDKVTEQVTIGKNDPPYKFTERENALFRGKASVVDGTFQISFVVPKNIAYEYGPGKIGLYASDLSSGRDAGGSTRLVVGGSDPKPPLDTTPPIVQGFMGDTTFLNGGVVIPNTVLVVKLQDASGINISEYGVGNSLTAVLDGAETFSLSEYYVAATDNYSKGWVHFPMEGLTPGRHAITIYAWDTFNNPAEATVDFIVTDGEELVIEDFANYPNPFQNETSVYFTHNRSGDDLQAMLVLCMATGQVIKTYEFDIPQSGYQVDLLDIDAFAEFGKKLPGGVYLARLAVRSVTNGSKSERVTKLIVVN
ncbi:type IX secretion system sortase PorU [Chryseolinea sp. T2]|uniref:type IX secretion system sortase PorU n=1 Tax=Chryseolinea sp. T2 TaxID=3129255 RepID=UPI0030768C85